MIVSHVRPPRGFAFPSAKRLMTHSILPPVLLRGVVATLSALLVGCASVRNAEFDQLIADGDFVQAKRLMQRLLDEYSVRDNSPTLPLRVAEAYYWLAYAHGRLAEYDSMNVALLQCVSHHVGFADKRRDLMLECALQEADVGRTAFNNKDFARAAEHFSSAATILAADSVHRRISGLILRNLALAQAASGDIAAAASRLAEAVALGDGRSDSLLAQLRMQGSIAIPLRTEAFTADAERTEEIPLSTDRIPTAGATPDPEPPVYDPPSRDGIAWTVYTLHSHSLEEVPYRGAAEYLPLFNGISSVNGGLHVRGSRDRETDYLLEGISVLNPFTNEDGVPLIPEALESIELHSGAYGASLGSRGGGTVISRMKTGGERFKVFVDFRGDGLAAPGKQFFGTSSFGYKNLVGTMEGPLPLETARFFVAAEHTFLRDREPLFLNPFRYDLVTDNLGPYPPGTPLPQPMVFARNHLPNNWLERTTVQGNAAFSLAGIDMKLIGSYRNEIHPEGQWSQALRRVLVQNRNPLNKTTTRFAALKASMSLDSKTRADVSVSWYDRFHRIYDPDFRHNIRAYTDSLANAQRGYGGFLSRFQPPPPYSVIFNFVLDHPSTPNNAYSRENQSAVEFSADVMHRMFDAWRLEAGGRLSFWTMRLYHIENIRAFMTSPWLAYSSEEERRVGVMRGGSISTAGYRYDDPSAEVDDGPDGPLRPNFGSFYVRNLLDLDVATIDLGLRYELLDPRLTAVPKSINPVTGVEDWQQVPFNLNLNMLMEERLIKTPAYQYLLPRIGMTFFPTERTTARFAYGSFVQLRQLEDLFRHNVTLSALMHPNLRVPYNLGWPAVSFTAEPERSRHVEVGIAHTTGSGISVGVVYYQKSMDNQLQLERVTNSEGTPIFVALRNGAKGFSSGWELSADIPLGRHASTRVWYTYSRTEGRIFDPHDWRYVSDYSPGSQYAESLIPADYDQTHRGTVMGSVVVPENDESFFAGMSLSVVFSFRSGQRYTAVAPPEFLGAANPWNIGVRTLFDYRSTLSTSFENEITTPWYYNVDVRFKKSFSFSPLTIELVVDVLNLFNRKHILNVFPTTGYTNDDGWLQQTQADFYKSIPLYEEFYRTAILENRWAYMNVTGNDMYGTPRQIRLGLSLRY